MNSVQLHLALTHVPVILSLISLVMLITALFLKNNTVTKTSYVLMLIAGIATLPVFFTGEGAEEAVENLPNVSAAIERHEEVAKFAMLSIAVAGLAALTALFSFKWKIASKVFKMMLLVLAVVSGGLMAQTAHLGGQIRHTEIRNGVAFQNSEVDINGNENNHSEEKDDD